MGFFNKLLNKKKSCEEIITPVGLVEALLFAELFVAHSLLLQVASESSEVAGPKVVAVKIKRILRIFSTKN